VSATPEQTRLSESQHVTVILRLVVDARGQLLYGEVVSANHETLSRFGGWRELSKTVRACLASLLSGVAPDSLPAPPAKKKLNP